MPLLKLILSPIVFFTFLGGLFHFLERRSGKHPRPLQLRKGFWTDIFYFLSAPALKAVMKLLLIAPAMVLVMMQVTSPAELKAGLYHGYGPLGSQPAWLQLLEIYILVDLCGYWMHRLFHTGRWWPFHAIHHSSEELDWLSSVRVHPLNEMLNHVAQATPVLLLGFNPLLTLTAAPFLTLYAIALHADLPWDFGPLRACIASPVFHRWHHSTDPEAIDKNFAGLLPLWDVLFGTFYMPKDKLPERFGADTPIPVGFLSQLWHPFSKRPRH